MSLFRYYREALSELKGHTLPSKHKTLDALTSVFCNDEDVRDFMNIRVMQVS